jgi:hypothetical protein
MCAMAFETPMPAFAGMGDYIPITIIGILTVMLVDIMLPVTSIL